VELPRNIAFAAALVLHGEAQSVVDDLDHPPPLSEADRHWWGEAANALTGCALYLRRVFVEGRMPGED
jgi:hypothetical protein